jgi:hypothetical protein
MPFGYQAAGDVTTPACALNDIDHRLKPRDKDRLGRSSDPADPAARSAGDPSGLVTRDLRGGFETDAQADQSCEPLFATQEIARIETWRTGRRGGRAGKKLRPVWRAIDGLPDRGISTPHIGQWLCARLYDSVA